MLRSRLGLKALGLCALLLGLMAFASTAQAEPGSYWSLINSKGDLIKLPGAEDLLPETEITLENNTAELLYTTKGGTKVANLCTSANWDEGGLLIDEGGMKLGRLLLQGCLTKLNGVTSGACKPSGGGTAAGSGQILTEKFKGLILLDEVSAGVKEEYIKFIPENSKGETTKLFSKIELGPECAIGEFVNLEAKTLGEGLWLKDCPVGGTSNQRALEYSAEHLMEQALPGTTLLALGQPATLDGSMLLKLVGTEKGLRFRGNWK
jgi:hypothetical protein